MIAVTLVPIGGHGACLHWKVKKVTLENNHPLGSTPGGRKVFNQLTSKNGKNLCG